MAQHCHILFILLMIIPMCQTRIWEVPIPRSLQACYNQVKRQDVGTFVESTFSWFCESATRSDQHQKIQFDREQLSYFRHLLENAHAHIQEVKHDERQHLHGSSHLRNKRQTTKCIRREYRTLTDQQRQTFHDAVNTLKHDTTVLPNKYDALALLHTSEGIKSAHGGAGFPGWHRIYILMFETALREVNEFLCLPYWDSSMDEGLEDPVLSQIWSPQFFGTAHGPVVTGPFANWTTPRGVPLLRDVGSDGELISPMSLRNVLSRRRHEDILSSGRSSIRYRLEHHHNSVHKFVGGTMDKLDGAAFDPIFFLHHAFIDMVWEQFRSNLRRRGRNPETYPYVRGCSRRSGSRRNRHCHFSKMSIIDLTQEDGYRDSWTSFFEYEESPNCLTDCASAYLMCNISTHRCIPINHPVEAQPVSAAREKRSISNQATDTQSCFGLDQKAPTGKYSRRLSIRNTTISNDFCCNDVCDAKQWVNIPVIIITKAANSQTTFPNPKTYKQCSVGDTITEVFLTSRGINYNGFYKEVVRLDNTLPVSLALRFVKVMNPEKSSMGSIQTLLRVHDSCGRMCHSVCRDVATGQVRGCSGAVAVDTARPLVYGKTLDEVVIQIFHNQFPVLEYDSVFISFYCDHHSDFTFYGKL